MLHVVTVPHSEEAIRLLRHPVPDVRQHLIARIHYLASQPYHVATQQQQPKL